MRAPVVRMAAMRPDFGRRFCLFVDTEEDFDWDAPFSRSGHQLESVPALATCQNYFAGHGVKPLYLVDYPIVNDPRAVDILGGYAAAGSCDIGVQLHPWVNPPYEEVVSRFNSFAGNLPCALEEEKIRILKSAIRERLAVDAVSYRAGRYGLGPNTIGILQKLGFRMDSSVRSRFDYSKEGGPDYTREPLHPYWTGADGAMLELPLTSVVAGLLRNLHGDAYLRAVRFRPGRAIFARLRLAERIALTPEGIPAKKACDAIDIALDKGIPLLNFSFHSPSLMPGHTPYVRTETDLQAFYRWWDIILAHLARRGVEPASQDDILAACM